MSDTRRRLLTVRCPDCGTIHAVDARDQSEGFDLCDQCADDMAAEIMSLDGYRARLDDRDQRCA